jgi:hypothetical protein
MPMSDANAINIIGGAGPLEAAVVAAVIQQVVADERSTASSPERREKMSNWVLAGRAEPFVAPRIPSLPNSRPTKR